MMNNQINLSLFPESVCAKLAEINATVLRVEVMGPHFTKYHLSNGQVLHNIRPDTGDEFHTHPWPFDAEMLDGRYKELIATPQADGTAVITEVWRNKGDRYRTEAQTIHRIPEMPEGQCWTLVQPGAWEGHSGFYRFDDWGIWFRYHYESQYQLETARA